MASTTQTQQATAALKAGLKPATPRQAFHEDATDLTITLEGQEYTLPVFGFSTGSEGWRADLKVAVRVGDATHICQATVQVVVGGSKRWA